MAAALAAVIRGISKCVFSRGIIVLAINHGSAINQAALVERTHRFSIEPVCINNSDSMKERRGHTDPTIDAQQSNPFPCGSDGISRTNDGWKGRSLQLYVGDGPGISRRVACEVHTSGGIYGSGAKLKGRRWRIIRTPAVHIVRVALVRRGDSGGSRRGKNSQTTRHRVISSGAIVAGSQRVTATRRIITRQSVMLISRRKQVELLARRGTPRKKGCRDKCSTDRRIDADNGDRTIPAARIF